MYGIVTQYMGTAYTGLGISHKYNELIASASKTIFLKSPPTNVISKLLNEIGSRFLQRGFDIDKFFNPTHPELTDAVFVRGPNILYIQASYPVALEPVNIGGKHHVVSFYDIYDEEKLREKNGFIVDMMEESGKTLAKAMKSIADAKVIHDEWESINIKRMMWNLHKNLIVSMKEELFESLTLNKKSTVSHRLIGSMTSGGAYDFIPSITKSMARRILIKGLPGSGKSTLMKALGTEAERRGIDVLYGWCGLDPAGVDLVLFPELSVCILDATMPHAYEPERPGDEILDLVHMCEEDEIAEGEVRAIREIYSEKILDATGYMQAFAQADNTMKIAMDSAIKESIFEQKSEVLLSTV